jgi:hypothetical protein
MRGRLVPMVVFSLIPLALVSVASASSDTAARDAWCIEPENLSRVVVSAEVLGLGTASGADGKMIDPAGPTERVSVRQWQTQSPEQFRSACDDAYDAHFGLASDDGGSGSDDETLGEELGLATVPALLGAAAGATAGYGFTKLGRTDERRHQQALALQKALGDLISELDQLIAKTPSESVEGADKLAVRRRAVDLLTQIPASSSCAGPATEAVAGLIGTLAETKLPDPQFEVDNLEVDKKEIVHTVNRVISEL